MSIDPNHIEAVAWVLHGRGRRCKEPAWRSRLDARLILESTDPTVHAALLAALVRAGVLEEEHRDCCSTCGAAYGSCENIDEACTEAAWIEQRRYLSKWEETCD